MVVLRMDATNQPIRLDGAVKYFPVIMDGIHAIHTSIPRVHEYGRKRDFFAENSVLKHTLKVIQFALTIPILIINTIINCPKFITPWIVVKTSDNPNTPDYSLSITTVV